MTWKLHKVSDIWRGAYTFPTGYEIDTKHVDYITEAIYKPNPTLEDCIDTLANLVAALHPIIHPISIYMCSYWSRKRSENEQCCSNDAKNRITARAATTSMNYCVHCEVCRSLWSIS